MIKSERAEVEKEVSLNEAREYIVDAILSGPRRGRYEHKLGFQLAEAMELMLTQRMHTVESFAKEFKVPVAKVKTILSGEFNDILDMMEIADALGYAMNIEIRDYFSHARDDDAPR